VSVGWRGLSSSRRSCCVSARVQDGGPGAGVGPRTSRGGCLRLTGMYKERGIWSRVAAPCRLSALLTKMYAMCLLAVLAAPAGRPHHLRGCTQVLAPRESGRASLYLGVKLSVIVKRVCSTDMPDAGLHRQGALSCCHRHFRHKPSKQTVVGLLSGHHTFWRPVGIGRWQVLCQVHLWLLLKQVPRRVGGGPSRSSLAAGERAAHSWSEPAGVSLPWKPAPQASSLNPACWPVHGVFPLTGRPEAAD
jgi:hypothetical protein